MRTALTNLLGLTVPLIQAPMAGVSTPALAGAVTGAGGLGSVAVGAMSPAEADRAVEAAMAATAGHVQVNVFTHPAPARDQARERAWLERLRPFFEALNAPVPETLHEIYRTFDDEPQMLEVLMGHRPPVVSFHFGLPNAKALAALKSYGAYVMATATSVAEARQLRAAEMDVIVAQGYEAGGHRGWFADGPDECLSTFTLLPRIVAAVDVPVVAAGGISTGAGIAAALDLGAAGVQMGTAFVDTPESAAGEAYREALRAEDRITAMTPLFSGRRARGLVNRFVCAMGGSENAVPDYPVAYDAAKRLAAAAAAAGMEGFAALWAGQGPVRAERLPAAELVRRLAGELHRAREERTPAPDLRDA